MRITEEEFQRTLPQHNTEEGNTDIYYCRIANRLLEAVMKCRASRDWPEEVLKRVALSMTGYFEDVVSDGGVWRGFVSEHRRLYGGRTLPFYPVGEDYIDFELNPEDVRFLTWYFLSMMYEHTRLLSPLDPRVESIADALYQVLEENYEEAPVPEYSRLAHGLDIYEPSDGEKVLRLGSWLYLRCWLLTPANLVNLATAGEDLPEGEKGRIELSDRINKMMRQYPTGPLALYLQEWLWLTVEDRMPPKPRNGKEEENVVPHPYYDRFLASTGGKRIAYFGDYASLNNFFIEALGWEAGEEHLSQLKGERDFVLLVNSEKGMLLAKNIARNIADPDNPYYDREYARRHAIGMLTVRGECPFDLLEYVCGKGWLPDATFPGKVESFGVVADNWDFIARCYLQQYYRGD